MKKTAAVIVAAIMLLCCFGACSRGGTAGYPLTVNSTAIDGEVFRYFLNEAWNEDGVSGKEARIQRATELCIRYVAVNSTFSTSGLKLSAAQKSESSLNANALWEKFGKFYESIGVSKQTFIKIHLSGEYTETLRLAYFDKGGPDEIPDEVLRGYFRDNYTAFRMISAPLSKTDANGEKQELTAEERARTEESYSLNAGRLNAGTDFDAVCKMIVDEVPSSQQAVETLVARQGSAEFAPAFYEAVRGVEEGKAGLFEDEDFIYLIVRVNVLSDGALFEKYRSVCLNDASEPLLQSKINMMCNSYSSKRNSSLVGDYYREMAGVKGNG